jgi:hypothetical protein
VAGLRTVCVANAAWTWFGNGLLNSLLKPAAIVLRRATEWIWGFVYFGRPVPLDPEVTVVVEAS